MLDWFLVCNAISSFLPCKRDGPEIRLPVQFFESDHVIRHRAAGLLDDICDAGKERKKDFTMKCSSTKQLACHHHKVKQEATFLVRVYPLL